MDKTANEQLVRQIDHLETAVLRTNHFPIYGQEFVSPHLTIAINLNGIGHAFYDHKEVYFRKNEIATILPNHLMQPIESSDDYEVILIVISNIMNNEVKKRMQRYNHDMYHINPSFMLDDSQLEKLLAVVNLIDTISKMSIEQMQYRHNALLNTIEVFFDMLHSFRQLPTLQSNITKGQDLFNRFCDLLASNYYKEHELSFYADKLYMTPKYFSQIIKETTGISASKWIENYIITQAQQLLLNRHDLNIQSICFLLGFKEQAAFSRFFTHSVGISPKKYRQQNGE